MVQEVIDRVELVISVQGGRRISMENLEFMFEKYELTDEQRQQVLDYCEKRQIKVYRESSIPADFSASRNKVEKSDEKVQEAPVKKEKKSFFGRLFGR